jgi:hypothetical protein
MELLFLLAGHKKKVQALAAIFAHTAASSRTPLGFRRFPSIVVVA